MKILFILLTLTHSIFAQNILSKPQETNNFEIKKDYKLFYIQVGTFRNMKYATIVFDHLEEMNYPLRLKEKQIGLYNYFKLFIGPYRTKEEAYLIKDSLPSQYTDSFVLTDNN